MINTRSFPIADEACTPQNCDDCVLEVIGSVVTEATGEEIGEFVTTTHCRYVCKCPLRGKDCSCAYCPNCKNGGCRSDCDKEVRRVRGTWTHEDVKD